MNKNSSNTVAFLLRHLLFTLFLFTALNGVEAQTSIQGVVNNKNQEPLQFANVLLLQPADSTLVMGEITNEKGEFMLKNVQPGNYLIQVSMVGYKNIIRSNLTIPVNSKSQIIEPFVLENQITDLEAAQVTA